jgi:hypothetical protein
MPKNVLFKYVPPGGQFHEPPCVIVVMDDGEKSHALGSTKERDLQRLQAKGEGGSWELRGYTLWLKKPLEKDMYTLSCLDLSPYVWSELEVFFVLFCEIEDYKSLSFTVEETSR